MSNVESFGKVYNEIKSKNEMELNEIYLEAKKETKKRRKITLIICLIVDIVIVVLMLILNNISNDMQLFDKNYVNTLVFGYFRFMPIIAIDFVIWIVMLIIFNKSIREYSKKFKELVIKNLLSYFFDNLNYEPDSGIKESVYEEAEYTEYYNRYYSDDYVKAKLNNKNDISMAEITTEHVKKHTDSKGNTRTTTTTIFSGLFLKIKLDKSIGTNFKLHDNGSFFNKDRLKMDSQEFEKYFDVSCENKIVGMQILTSDVMEKLIQFYNISGIQYDIVIENDIMYLRFHCGKIFEIYGLNKGAIPEKALNKYYDILKFVCELSNEIIQTINNVEL